MNKLQVLPANTKTFIHQLTQQGVSPNTYLATLHIAFNIQSGLAIGHLLERTAELKHHEFMHFRELLDKAHHTLKQMAQHGINETGHQARIQYEALRQQIQTQYPRLIQKLSAEYHYLFHQDGWLSKRLHQRIGWHITSEKLAFDIAHASEYLNQIAHGIFVIDLTYSIAQIAKSYTDGDNWLRTAILESSEFTTYLVCSFCVDCIITAIVATPLGWCVIIAAGVATIASQYALEHWLVEPYIERLFNQ